MSIILAVSSEIMPHNNSLSKNKNAPQQPAALLIAGDYC
jgi:hypothetical protein